MLPIEQKSTPPLDPDWLRERFRFDAEARCRKLETPATACFSGSTLLRVVDVGAGLGANTRYYSSLFSQNQEWILVESDRGLARKCLTDLSQWGTSLRGQCESSGNRLRIRLPDKQVGMEVVEGSLLNLECLVDLDRVDLVTANAVFDLFTQAQFQAFAALLFRHRLPLLSTLNYHSMSFEPEDREDETHIGLYETHMCRPRVFGTAMGGGCFEKMCKVLCCLGGKTEWGSSVWHINSQEVRMMRYLLDFMREALTELLSASPDLERMNQWISQKEQRMREVRLSLKVEHRDLFWRPLNDNRFAASP